MRGRPTGPARVESAPATRRSIWFMSGSSAFRVGYDVPGKIRVQAAKPVSARCESESLGFGMRPVTIFHCPHNIRAWFLVSAGFGTLGARSSLRLLERWCATVGRYSPATGKQRPFRTGSRTGPEMGRLRKHREKPYPGARESSFAMRSISGLPGSSSRNSPACLRAAATLPAADW